MDLHKPSTSGAPYIALRGRRYYVLWYDPIGRRTKRVSLQTKVLAMAEARAATAYEQATGISPAADEGDGKTLTWKQWAQKMCRRARENAKAKGRAYSITPEYVETLMLVQGHRCAITEHPFSRAMAHRNPFAPSLDQIKPGAGYTEDNVRVVLTLVNTAMNMWGPQPLLKLVNYIARLHLNTRQHDVERVSTVSQKEAKALKELLD